MCIAVSGMIFAGIFAGYVQSAHGAERSEQSRSVLGLAQADEGKSPAAKEAVQHPTVVLADADLSISIAD